MTQGLSGIVFQTRVAIASTGNLGLSGLTAIDGVTPVAGDLILAKNQTAPAENGIWIASSGAWSRASTFEAISGLEVLVSSGSAGANTAWKLTTSDPIVLGTTSLTFVQAAGSGTGPGTDVLVKVTSGDATAQYLDDKVVVQAPLVKAVIGAGTLQEQLSVTDFVASGPTHARGTVPDPGAAAGTSKYLREDATWNVPPTGGAGTFGTATMSFAGQRAVTTVADAGVAPGSHLQAWLQSEDGPPVGNPFHAYEAEVLRSYIGLSCGNIVAGVSFDVVGVSQVTLLGDFTFHWQRG